LVVKIELKMTKQQPLESQTLICIKKGENQ